MVLEGDPLQVLFDAVLQINEKKHILKNRCTNPDKYPSLILLPIIELVYAHIPVEERSTFSHLLIEMIESMENVIYEDLQDFKTHRIMFHNGLLED